MSKNSHSLFSAFTIAFLDNFGLSLVFIMFAPLILNPSYGFFSNQTPEGTKNIFLGVLIGAFPILTFFSAPFWGDFADRFGRKKAFLLTILGTVAGHLLSALGIFLESYAFLLTARALAGFFSGNISICLAIISDLSSNSKVKGKNLGIWTVVLGFGWILAMLLGGYLSDPTLAPFFTPVLPFLIAAFLTFCGYLVVHFWFTETHHRKESVHFDLIKSLHDIKNALYHHLTRPYFFTVLFWSLGWFFTFQWFTAVSLEKFHVSQETTSLYLIVLGIVWMFGGIFLNPLLVKKFAPSAIALGSIFFTAFFILSTTLTDDYFTFSLLFWIATLSAPVGLSTMLNIVSSSVPGSIQGKVMGFTQSFQSLAGVLVPLAGGSLAKIDIGLIFPVGSILLFLAFLLLFFKTIQKN